MFKLKDLDQNPISREPNKEPSPAHSLGQLWMLLSLYYIFFSFTPTSEKEELLGREWGKEVGLADTSDLASARCEWDWDGDSEASAYGKEWR